MGIPLSVRRGPARDATSHHFRRSAEVAAIAASFVAVTILQGCSEPPQAEATQLLPSSDYASLYEDDTLAYWATRYEPAIRENLKHLILDSLSGEQRRKTRGLIFQFPRKHPADPLTYFADAPPPTITMSVLSVKFLDDFATAMVWLGLNGYSIETAGYYADVLKYRGPEQFANARYPSPLRGMGIPPDALKNTVVNDVALKTLNTAVVFALAHEVGHLVNEHNAEASSEQRQQQEIQADSFAINAFKRIGLAPAGMFTFFFITSRLGHHRGDFKTDSAWTSWLSAQATHPLSSRRLKAISSALQSSPESFARSEGNRAGAVQQVQYIALQIDGISTILDDPLLHRQAKLVGEQIPLNELRPRKPGLPPWVPRR